MMTGPIYVAGPMSGYEDFNIPAFAEVARVLRREYHLQVVSPHELDQMDGGIEGGKATRSWSDYLRRDLKALANCNTIVTLPGWRESRGAKLEQQTAVGLGMEWWAAIPYSGQWTFFLMQAADPSAAVIPTTDVPVEVLKTRQAAPQPRTPGGPHP